MRFLAVILASMLCVGVIAEVTKTFPDGVNDTLLQPVETWPNGIFDPGAGNGAPDMAVNGATNTIPNGDTSPSTAKSTEFETVTLDDIATNSFSITNTGSAALILTDATIVGITGSTNFYVHTQPASTNIPINTETSFLIAFDPSALGVVSSLVSIANSDIGKDPYTFWVQGEGIAGGYSIPTDDLFWYFQPTNSAQTNTIVDLSGNSHDGVETGANNIDFVAQSATVVGHLDLTALDSAYILGGAPTNDGLNGYTIHFWLMDDSGAFFQDIFATEFGNFQMRWAGASPGRIGYTDGVTARNFDNLFPPNDGTWHFISIEFDPSNDASRYYLDDAATPTGTNLWTLHRAVGGAVATFALWDAVNFEYRGFASTHLMYTNGSLSAAAATAIRTNLYFQLRAPNTDIETMGHGWIGIDQVLEFDTAAVVLHNEYLNGTVIPDTSGNNRHFGNSGMTFATDLTNGTLSADGINDQATNAFAISSITSSVLMCWADFTALDQFDTFLSHNDNSPLRYTILDGGNADGNDLRFLIGTSAETIILQTTNTLSLTGWHHIAGQWASGEMLQIFIDGALVAEVPVAAGTMAFDGARAFTVANDQVTPTRWANFIVDDVYYLTNDYLTASQYTNIVGLTESVHP